MIEKSSSFFGILGKICYICNRVYRKMIRYENYKMRVVEICHKKINLDTEEITDVVRYMLEWKFPGSFGWTKDTGSHYQVEKGLVDTSENTYGFYKLEDCVEYMKNRMKLWKENIDENDLDEARKRLEKKLKRKYRREMKTTRKVVMECCMVDLDK